MKTNRAACFVLALLSLACAQKSGPGDQAKTDASNPSVGRLAVGTNAPQSLMIVARFSDGSQLRGTPSCETILLQTPYADLTVQWNDLSSIDFARDSAMLRISLRNGDQLHGTLKGEMCRLKTLVGDIALDPRNLVSIQVMGPVDVSDSGLFAYYPLDGDAKDASGNHNDGVAAGITPTADHRGVANAAALFDGARSSISVPSGPSMHPGDQLTFSFWIRIDQLTNYSPVFHKGGVVHEDFTNREYSAYIKRTGDDVFQLQVWSAGDQGGQHGLLSTENYPVHEWLFVAAVFDRQLHKTSLYVNDSLQAHARDSYSSFNANDFPLTIGVEAESFTEHTPLAGALDELRFYKRALTRAELHALFVSE